VGSIIKTIHVVLAGGVTVLRFGVQSVIFIRRSPSW
jgi:hypothetical protein